jgi:dihydroflavonol-4-reductase
MLTTDRIFTCVYRGMADAVKHSSTFGRNQLAMVAGLATLAAFDEEDVVANAARTGLVLREALAPLVERYPLLRSVRGLGLMVGLEFGEPETPALRRMFRTTEQLRPGLFSQLVVLPLFQRHRILTQVAGHNLNVIRLLPPLIAGANEVEYFVQALGDVLADAHRGYRLFPEVSLTVARGVLGVRANGAPPVPQGWPRAGSAASTVPAAAPGGRWPAERGHPLAATASVGPPANGDRAEHGRGRPAGAGTWLPPESETAATGESVRLETGDRVVVTGATGFIGSAVVRALLARGADVVALMEPGADDRNLEGTAVQRTVADIRDAGAVQAACRGARFVFHLAALYRFWAPDPQIFYDVNVRGTHSVLAAVRAAGCERLVYTSTVGVLGLDGTRQGGQADETSYAEIGHLFGPYKQSKYVAEHEVLRAAAEGLDISLALPTFPLGPGDIGPTPTGKVVLDFLNGKLPAFTDTVLNVVHVDDLASGHVAVLERGKRGRSYILGGENLAMRSILQVLSDCTGLAMPRFEVPRELALGAGIVSDVIEGKLLGRAPRVPLEAARMSTTKMTFNDMRARTELGYRSRPAREAIEDSARWFAANGYLAPGRCAAISIRDS